MENTEIVAIDEKTLVNVHVTKVDPEEHDLILIRAYGNRWFRDWDYSKNCDELENVIKNLTSDGTSEKVNQALKEVALQLENSECRYEKRRRRIFDYISHLGLPNFTIANLKKL